MSKKRDRRVTRASIVMDAAHQFQCSVEELYIRAMPENFDIVVDMRKIPDEVVGFAEKMRAKYPEPSAGPPPRKIREPFFRAAPHMAPC